MDPLQTSPITSRPDLDDEGGVAWAPGESPRPLVVPVVTPASASPWPAERPTAWQPTSRPMPLATPPAWGAPAVTELGRLIDKLAGATPAGPPSYPPLRPGVRTYRPFGG